MAKLVKVGDIVPIKNDPRNTAEILLVAGGRIIAKAYDYTWMMYDIKGKYIGHWLGSSFSEEQLLLRPVNVCPSDRYDLDLEPKLQFKAAYDSGDIDPKWFDNLTYHGKNDGIVALWVKEDDSKTTFCTLAEFQTKYPNVKFGV